MKALTVVKTERADSIGERVKKAMSSPGWMRGIIRARREFADNDRRSALASAALGLDYEALSLHRQADQHEEAMDQACKELARVMS